MATEVSCGQCYGRLLVETLGVVVACPHCGTHLSIPAPAAAPVPAPVETPVPAPTPAPEVTFAAASPPEPAAVTSVPPTIPEPETNPPVTFEAVPAPPAADVSSVLEGTDDGPQSVGWHSAPNLYLTPESPPISGEPQSPVVFATSPAETSADAPVQASTDVQFAAAPPVTFEAAAAPPIPPEIPPAQTGFEFSSTQQFSLAAIAEAAAPPASAGPAPIASPQTPGTVVAAQAPVVFGAAPAMAPAASAPAVASPATGTPVLTFGAAPPPPSMAVPAAPGFPVFGAAPVSEPSPLVAGTTVAEDAAAFAESESEARQRFLLMLLIIVGSYASAVSIVLAYILIFVRSSDLESLPDLVPPKNKNGDISWRYNPPVNNVPPGHVMYLGTSRRFGNVKVTPLRVTKGPVKFEHYAGQPGATREPSEPVWKLWVKFENVSRDQTFAPLDPKLVYTRDVRGMGDKIRANGFVATEAERRKGKPECLIFDMPVLSEFRMLGQNLNRELQPGESVEAFIPAEEDARNLKGDVTWRFQFRKGYNPKSLRGVTTLIDVRFNSKDVTEDRA